MSGDGNDSSSSSSSDFGPAPPPKRAKRAKRAEPSEPAVAAPSQPTSEDDALLARIIARAARPMASPTPPPAATPRREAWMTTPATLQDAIGRPGPVMQGRTFKRFRGRDDPPVARSTATATAAATAAAAAAGETRMVVPAPPRSEKSLMAVHQEAQARAAAAKAAARKAAAARGEPETAAGRADREQAFLDRQWNYERDMRGAGGVQPGDAAKLLRHKSTLSSRFGPASSS
ncbi:hypothetical protein CXG81DRAFT_18157 [Caulochytrium protostelioides]|uniref:DUF3752 domain-containing protein n=1 Tax=Caulochytrium protostelioides TaxID=1555241 RepID=A0A4P9X9Y2_9FUNG|nr:hypothetical protein CXG81DRAFT_18157 [Caulochytrium protostelioides]|eukprot:RKP02115.1 hypothetical protein CXG81DRAFT_18157 [Caulochytrium protostelioides]